MSIPDFIYTVMTAGVWELVLYPEAPKVLVLRVASCRPRSNSVCFCVFFVAALLAIGREGSERSTEEMVLR